MSADTISGSLKLADLPDLFCFTSWPEFLKALPDLLTVEIPAGLTNVVITNVQPNDTQRDFVWFRMSNGGSFIGIYLFSAGKWTQFFPVPLAIYHVAGGDSRTPPDGYILTEDASYLTANERAKIRETWLLDVTNTYYTIFDMVVAPI